ncbi:hypothetical protein [Mesorhizobium sp. M2C.T.Ca.TU.002.02.1.1]|jgi:hypothetical protein|uniref:hypothetical protein n=1 Tax=Mesorhizobium sp. M2C.T.Ca.TU.002.02.1.1 TaxID=2496788 RepID=UPI000FCCB23B|nr:hypothetical protein [Mesorhizobium sp. M2C.T.Ca.TU.002.02.1.1]RUU59043.1 hypothetical protein EOD07_08245 [Mesorhizobium sp. M2C.T.Ca.TU.002.02.1.1]RUU63383.1 hypothetical protein EOD04_22930 [Mesorhizobium sp. M2C.T.Ca.TU.009.01.2.1]
MRGHLIQAEEQTQLITIYRIDSGGVPTLFTSVSFDEARKMGLEKFGKLLGENLILDSPKLRDLFLQ